MGAMEKTTMSLTRIADSPPATEIVKARSRSGFAAARHRTRGGEAS